VEPADLRINLALHEQAKARKLAHGEPLPAVIIAPSARKGLHVLLTTVVITLRVMEPRAVKAPIGYVLNQPRRCRIVGHRPGQSNASGGGWRVAGGGRDRLRARRRTVFDPSAACAFSLSARSLAPRRAPTVGP